MEILETTESLCPVCLSRLPAHYILRGNEVYFRKQCPGHGAFETLVWEDQDHFMAWQSPLSDIDRTHTMTEADQGCPFDCGICPSHRQDTCCVLLEVTDRCNLRCPVCYAGAGEGAADPSLAQISQWYDMLMAQGGPYNIQLSGGEPTLRDDLDEIIRLGKKKGFSFFQLNTNGLRLAREPEYLEKLKNAGLNTVFLQFDGLEDKTYLKLRGDGNLLRRKEQAIENSKNAGIGVVLVPTLLKGVNDGEIGNIIHYAFDRMPWVRGVHFQPMAFFGRYQGVISPHNNRRLTIPGILKAIEAQTGGLLKAADFTPSATEHFRCSFHGDFMRDKNGGVTRLKTEQNCCSSSQARDVVARKWSIQEPEERTGGCRCSCTNTDALDEFLRRRQKSTLSISGMAFQDVWNLDLNRLKRCYINIVSKEGKMIPFCAYNLTSAEGVPLYRK